MFEYTQQPPSTTLSSCNPYLNGSIIFIALDCTLRNQTNEFELRWFRENTTGAVEDMGLGYYEFEKKMQLRSRLYYFFNLQYNPSYLGKYWCQVINTTADPDQPLMRSNVFTLLAPENYTQPTCVNLSTAIHTMNNMTCADLPVHSEQTTLPAPTTTLSSLHKLSCKIPDSPTEAKNTCTSMAMCMSLSLTNATSGSYVTNITSSTISPASPTASVLLIVYPVAAVLSAVIVIVSVILVTVILLLLKRQRIKKRG